MDPIMLTVRVQADGAVAGEWALQLTNRNDGVVYQQKSKGAAWEAVARVRLTVHGVELVDGDVQRWILREFADDEGVKARIQGLLPKPGASPWPIDERLTEAWWAEHRGGFAGEPDNYYARGAFNLKRGEVGLALTVGIAAPQVGLPPAWVYELLPRENLTAEDAKALRRKVKSAEAKGPTAPDPLHPNGLFLRAPMPPREYARLYSQLLPGERPQAPVVAAPTTMPVDLDNLLPGTVKLLQQKIASRTKGNVPVDVVRNLLGFLPGWSVSDLEPGRRIVVDNWSTGRRDFVKLMKEEIVGGDGRVSIQSSTVSREGTTVDPGEGNLMSMIARLRSAFGPSLSRDGWHVERIEAKAGPYSRALIDLGHVRRDDMAWVVRAPSGATWPLWKSAVYTATKTSTERLIDDPTFWTWAYKQGLGEAADAFLASLGEDFIEALLKFGNLSASDHGGHCQICGGVYQLRKAGYVPARTSVAIGRFLPTPSREPVLGDHGFNFPGSEGYRGGMRGERNDICLGVGWRPLEIAHDAIDAMLVVLPPKVEAAQRAYDASLVYNGPLHAQKRAVTGKDEDGKELVEVLPGHRLYAALLSELQSQARRELRGLKGMLAGFQYARRRWKPMELSAGALALVR